MKTVNCPSRDRGGVSGAARFRRAGCWVPLPGMSTERDLEKRAETRAELLPEEATAGSEDSVHQAQEILRESDERTENPQPQERRRPQDTA